MHGGSSLNPSDEIVIGRNWRGLCAYGTRLVDCIRRNAGSGGSAPCVTLSSAHAGHGRITTISETAPNYNLIHAKRAAELLRIAGTRVLVVGANAGHDCRYFKEWGAAEVHGLDVLEYTGADYQAPGVTYHIESAEAMSLASDYFDLVYCFATMEHIPQVDMAFREMARVTRSGGVIYCIAAPLWNSRFGHHKGNLFSEPWIHLRMTRDEIVDYAHENGIDAPGGIEGHVDYMLDPANMNQIPARRYVEACKSLPGMKTVRNDLDCEPPEAVPPDVLSELTSRGYAGEELRAVTHTYIGQKRSVKGRLFGWLPR